LVVLVVINKKAESLVEVLVYNLGLAISLKIKYNREFNFNPKDMAEFILEI